MPGKGRQGQTVPGKGGGKLCWVKGGCTMPGRGCIVLGRGWIVPGRGMHHADTVEKSFEFT